MDRLGAEVGSFFGTTVAAVILVIISLGELYIVLLLSQTIRLVSIKKKFIKMKKMEHQSKIVRTTSPLMSTGSLCGVSGPAIDQQDDIMFVINLILGDQKKSVATVDGTTEQDEEPMEPDQAAITVSGLLRDTVTATSSLPDINRPKRLSILKYLTRDRKKSVDTYFSKEKRKSIKLPDLLASDSDDTEDNVHASRTNTLHAVERSIKGHVLDLDSNAELNTEIMKTLNAHQEDIAVPDFPSDTSLSDTIERQGSRRFSILRYLTRDRKNSVDANFNKKRRKTMKVPDVVGEHMEVPDVYVGEHMEVPDVYVGEHTTKHVSAPYTTKRTSALHINTEIKEAFDPNSDEYSKELGESIYAEKKAFKLPIENITLQDIEVEGSMHAEGKAPIENMTLQDIELETAVGEYSVQRSRQNTLTIQKSIESVLLAEWGKTSLSLLETTSQQDNLLQRQSSIESVLLADKKQNLMRKSWETTPKSSYQRSSDNSISKWPRTDLESSSLMKVEEIDHLLESMEINIVQDSAADIHNGHSRLKVEEKRKSSCKSPLHHELTLGWKSNPSL